MPPGQFPMLTIRQLGGTLVVEGLTLKTVTNFEDPEAPMTVGAEYVLFLSRANPRPSLTMSAGSDSFELTSPHWGLYPIVNGKVASPSKWVARRTDRTTDDPAAFVAQIREFAKGSK